MAQACTQCGGVGYGTIDPEFGWRRGTEKGKPPIPCPTCEGRFATYAEEHKDDSRATPLEFGNYVEPRVVRVVTLDVVGGGDPNSVATDEYDPGVVNTGRETVSIEAALAATAGEG